MSYKKFRRVLHMRMNQSDEAPVTKFRLPRRYSVTEPMIAKYKRRGKHRRKGMVLRRLGLDDPKGGLFALLGALVLILISKLISSRH